MNKCQICNKETKNKKYCSKRCFGKWCSVKYSKRVEVTCKRCGKTRLVWPAHKHLYIHCSFKCRTYKRILNCLVCNKEFSVQRYRSTARFCSLKCKSIAQDRGISSKNEKIRKSTEYRNWRLQVFTRDNYTCQTCGKRGGYLHADHIKPFAYFPEFRFDLNNGQTLCKECHQKTATYGITGYRNFIKGLINAWN